MRLARTAVASTRSSAPTSASTSGRSRCSPPLRDVPQHGVALTVERRQVTFDGVRNDLPHNGDRIVHAAHEDHRDGRAGLRQRRRDRRAHRRRRGHLPPELLARHPREPGADVPPHPRAPRRAQDARLAILQDLGGPKIRTGTLEGGTPIQLEAGRSRFASRPAPRRAGPAASRRRSRDSRAASSPATGCCSPTASSSFASRRPTARRSRRRSCRAASSVSTRASTRPASRSRRPRSRRRTSRICRPASRSAWTSSRSASFRPRPTCGRRAS